MQDHAPALGQGAPLSLLLVGFLLAVATLHLAMYAGGRRKAGDLAFSLLAVFAALRVALMGGLFDAVFPGLPSEHRRLDGFPVFLLLPTFLHFLQALFPEESDGRIPWVFSAASGIGLAASLVLPPEVSRLVPPAYIPVTFAGVAFSLAVLGRAARARRSAVMQARVGTLLFGALLVLDLAGVTERVGPGKIYLALGWVAIFAACSAGLGRRMQDSYEEAREASRALARHNEELEALVENRTRELKEANEGLRRMAETDGLTGIANRRRFEAALAEERRRAARAGTVLSIGMFDADHFKAYNDTYGHLEGDECLKKIASVLASHARRPGDLAARYGGEEFALLLPDTDAPGALAKVQAAASEIRGLRIPHESSPFGIVTMSAGVASSLRGQDDIVLAADQALYAAKASGRDSVLQADLAAAAPSGRRGS